MEKEIIERYRKLFGFVPENIQQRLEMAAEVDRLEAFEVIENFRETLIYENPLDNKIQQIVHFALLIGAGHRESALYHAKGALKMEASLKEMFGVCETAAVTGGMPAFTLSTEVLYQAYKELKSTP